MAGEERFFCSARSRGNGEEIFGTVARVRSWFLLEYPGAWRRNAIQDSELLPQAARESMRTRWDRALLIRRGHRWDRPAMNAFVADSRVEQPSLRRREISNYEEIARIDDGGRPEPGLLFAVCTHGRHDKCCAKFGNPVWCALRDLAPERAWQCSHVGGDRFAANVVVFPHGLYYGRVRPEDVAELIEASDAGRVWMPGYRGRSCYGRAVQAAEYLLRRESGLAGIDDFRVAGAPEAAGDRTRVAFRARADGSTHVVEYTTIPDALRQRLTCGAAEESGIAQHRLVRYEVAR